MAFAQYCTATVILVGLSQDKIIFAADSRAKGYAGYRDNECKIAALGSETLYVASGMTGTNAGWFDVLYPGWSSRQFAIEAFRSTGGGSLVGIAEKWAEIFEQHVIFDLAMRFYTVFPSIENGVVAVAIFGHAGTINQFQIARVEVRCYDPSCYALTHEILWFPPGLTPQGNAATAEPLRLVTLPPRFQGRENDPSVVKALVEWAVRQNFSETVGGDVDVVELERGKPVHWVQRKPHCPKEN
jgi:hypothetical protein